MITKFVHDLLLPLLMCAFTRRYCILFRNATATSESGQFPRLQKAPKINWLYTIATSLGLPQNECQFHNPHAPVLKIC